MTDEQKSPIGSDFYEHLAEELKDQEFAKEFEMAKNEQKPPREFWIEWSNSGGNDHMVWKNKPSAIIDQCKFPVNKGDPKAAYEYWHVIEYPAYETLRARLEKTEVELWQAKGALGYPVPGHIPRSQTLKCGLCEARAIQEANKDHSWHCKDPICHDLNNAYRDLETKLEKAEAERDFIKAYFNPTDITFRDMMNTFHELSESQKDKLIDLARSLANLATDDKADRESK